MFLLKSINTIQRSSAALRERRRTCTRERAGLFVVIQVFRSLGAQLEALLVGFENVALGSFVEPWL